MQPPDRTKLGGRLAFGDDGERLMIGLSAISDETALELIDVAHLDVRVVDAIVAIQIDGNTDGWTIGDTKSAAAQPPDDLFLGVLPNHRKDWLWLEEAVNRRRRRLCADFDRGCRVIDHRAFRFSDEQEIARFAERSVIGVIGAEEIAG